MSLGLLACQGTPATTQPDPQPTVDLTTSPVITEPSPTPGPIATPPPGPVEALGFSTQDLPLSPYYPIVLSLYKGPQERIEEAEPLERQRIFLPQTGQVNFKTAALMTGDTFTLLLHGKRQDGRCLLEESYRLTTGQTAKAPFFRVIDTPRIQLGSNDLVLVNKNLQCQRTFRQSGRVINETGAPLADVEIRAVLKQQDGLGYSTVVTTDVDGRFEIVDAPTGVFLRLTAIRTGFQTRETTFSASVQNNGNLDQLNQLELVLSPA